MALPYRLACKLKHVKLEICVCQHARGKESRGTFVCSSETKLFAAHQQKVTLEQFHMNL